jgi:hypothetical protein
LDAYVDQLAIRSPYDPNPAHMSYDDKKNKNNKELKNINNVFLTLYLNISFVNIDIIPEMEWIFIQLSNPVVRYGIDRKIWPSPSYVEMDMKINAEC